MALDQPRLARLATLLDALAAQPADARRAWLAALPAADADLRAHLAEHLQALESDPTDAGNGPAPADTLWHDAPQHARAALARSLDSAELQPGHRLGPWRLQALLGRGGMGEVWSAERADGAYSRQVALKLPLPGLGTARLAERFARERDILAALVHPHIARLYDAGVADNGRPYLAMALVPGLPITRHADAAGLGLGDRVRLLLQVLSAVQYAHGQLVVHRDLKPGNIQVDSGGQVQLLDFGIARLLDDSGQGPVATPDLTEAGDAALTPSYAAPEQLLRQPVAASADQYALGVVAYELLCGASPYQPARPGRAGLEDAILHGDPVPPSRALTAQAAAQRGASAATLRRQLVGDLDAIVGKALAKAPAGRYPSVDALAQDLQRWLAGEPVQARAPGAAERLRKLLRRHRAASAGAAATALALLVGSGLALWQAGVARREARHAQAVQAFIVQLFNEADPLRAQGRTLTVPDLMGRAERDLAVQGAADPALAERLQAALTAIHINLGDHAGALPLAQARRDLALRLHGAASAEHGEALLTLGEVQLGLRQRGAELATLQQAQAVLAQHRPAHERGWLTSALRIAEHQNAMVEPAAARQTLQAVQAPFAQAFGTGSWAWVQFNAQQALADVRSDEHARAAATYAALQPLLDHPPADAPALGPALVRADLGLAQAQAGQWAAAEASYRRAIADCDRLAGPRNSHSLTVLRNLVQLQLAAAQFQPALATLDALRARQAGAAPATDEAALNDRSSAIRLLVWLGRLDEAEAIGRDTVRAADTNPTLSVPARRALQRRWGLALLANGQATQALALLQALAAQEHTATPALRANTQLYLAGALAALGRHAEAAEAAQHAAAGWAPQHSASYQLNAQMARLTEALARARAGQGAAAAPLLAQARAALAAQLPPTHAAFALVDLTAALVAQAGGDAGAAAQAAAARQRFAAMSGGSVPAQPLLFFF